MTWYTQKLSGFSPHRRAEQLSSQRLDAERGEGELSGPDAAWLEAHLTACDACRAHDAALQSAMKSMTQMPQLRAPDGFAGRVLAAARAGEGPRAEVSDLGSARPSGLALGGLAVAAAAALLFTVVVGTSPRGALEHEIEVSGTAAQAVGEAPHFVVRAPGVGAAQARAQVTRIVDDHQGERLNAGSAIAVRIPRAELLGVMQDLARRGRFKVSQVSAGELDPDLETIVLRFELE